jgi:cytochrome c-type biogenesis protein CcmH
VWTSLLVLLIGALLCAASAFWVLRAYRRAGGGARSPVPAIAACVLVSLAGMGAYLAIGRPELGDAPYQQRLEALKHRNPASFSADESLAVLHEASRNNPSDPLPLFYTGQLMLDQGRDREAARAFDAALRRDPELTEAILGLGRALVRIDNGRVTPEALALFERAAAVSDDPAPWIYQAMAAMEQGRDPDARRFWGEALARMPADDPRREMAQRMSAGG